jgi:LysM repeat protein
MKLKNIIASVAFVLALGISTSVYAATEVKLGDVTGTYDMADEIRVPIVINSTEDSRACIMAADITVEFDKDALYLSTVENNLKYEKTVRPGVTQLTTSSAVVEGDAETSNANGSHRFTWTSTNKTALSNSDSAFTIVMYPNSDGYTFNPADVKIKVNKVVFGENGDNDMGDPVYSDSFATYVTFEIPSDYTTNGYIHEVYLVLNDTKFKLENCIETETGYKFITSIKNSSDTKKSVAAKVVLGVADTEDATELKYVDYADLGTIQVEKF